MRTIKITFKFRKELTRTGEIIYRPVAEVFVKGKTSEWFLFYPYVDSGADITLFRRSDCKLLGIKLKDGRVMDMGGITRHTIKVYIHNLTVRIGGIEFKTEVGFANSDRIPHLLGRKGILDQFIISLDGKRKKVSFIK